ncbi:MAG: Imm21 family immunity protein [Planctomycetota bacterium]
MKQKWMSTDGGPFVVLPRSFLLEWHGIDTELREPTDYEAACSVNNYTGVLTRDCYEILVVNDEPLQTAFTRASHLPCLVRWRFASGPDAVAEAIRVLADVVGTLRTVQTMTWRVESADLVMFDAASDGRDEPELLEIDLTPGLYQVKTFLYDPSDSVGLVVHGFFKLGDKPKPDHVC